MEISLVDIFNILLKKIWILLVVTVLGLAIAFLVSNFLITPKWTSTATLYAEPNFASYEGESSYNELQYAQKLVNSIIVILKSDDLMMDVSRDFEGKYSAGQIKKMIGIEQVNNTEIFNVSVTAPDNADAFRILDSLVRKGREKVAEVRKFDTIYVLSNAKVPNVNSPSHPNIITNTLLGAFLGLFLAAAGVILLSLLDTRIKSEEDLQASYDIPVLGSIPRFESIK